MSDVQWRGVIAPLNTADAVGRKIKMSTTPNTRRLPLPLRYQPADWGQHTGAVQVGSIDRVWVEDSKLWGEGRFDTADPVAADVVRKIRNGFVRHMSADIEPVSDRLMAATIVDIPAFEDAEIKSLSPQQMVEEPELVSFSFRVVGDTGLSFAPREREWDSGAAEARVFAWAGGDNLDVNKYRRAFLYQDADADPKLKGSYKLPFADVIDGDLKAVPRGVFAVAGGRGVNTADIPQSDKETIKRRVSALYRKMAKQFDDPELRAPWDEKAMSVERFTVAVKQSRVAAALWDQAGVA